MTKTEKLIDEVLKLDADATKGPWWVTYRELADPFSYKEENRFMQLHPLKWAVKNNLDLTLTTDWEMIAHYRTAAPILAKMLKRAIEQRDRATNAYYKNQVLGDEAKTQMNVELDRIVTGERK